ncbi:MAG TPA: hypothetical protein VHR66_13640 [Gemmataceae bacterium]|nr:hypothetical protein [Gemmataceae bacterium]
MAELTPIPSTQRPAESGYQPVAGYAVAAMVVAGLFAIATLVLIYVAIRQQRTPLSYEVLVLAAGGVVLSIIGRSQIKSSEGTRTGLRLTAIAWWICVLGGAGFAAFLVANEQYLKRESRRSADEFFEDLRNGRMHSAFLLHMMPPDQRGRATPDAPEFEQIYSLGGYTAFANNEVVRMFQRNGAAVKFEHLGSRDVGQENNGFKITHSYRISAPEGQFDIDIKLIAVEKRAGEKLQWYCPGGAAGIGQPKPEFLTRYGRLRIEMEMEGDLVCKEWVGFLGNHRPGPAHLMTLTAAERERGDLALRRAVMLGGWFAANIDIPVEFLPGERAKRGKTGVDDLLESGFFRSDDDGSPVPSDKIDALKKYFRAGQLLPSNPTRGNPMSNDAAERPTYIRTESSVTVLVPMDLVMANPREFTPCTIAVECTNPEVIAAINAAFKEGANQKDDGSVTLRTLPQRDWRIAWFKTKMEPAAPLSNSNSPRMGPGGGGPR